MKFEFITFIILFILIIIDICINIKTYKIKLKFKEENQIKNQFSQLNFENDIKLLDYLIEENFKILENNLLTPLGTKKSDGFIKDEEANDIIAKFVIDVKNDMSEEYIANISRYINDIDLYITKKGILLITPHLLSINVNKLTSRRLKKIK